MGPYNRRRSRISAIRELAPGREGPLHVGWQQLRAALRGAAVVPDLVQRSFHARLGPHARLRPTATAVLDLLDGYFQAEGAGRLEEGRWLCHRDGDRDSARQIVARLRTVTPELGLLTFDTASDGQLVLRMAGGCEPVAPEEIEVEHLSCGRSRYIRRTVTVDGLVEAVNRLLARRGIAFRFLPLATPGDVDAYLAVDPRGAEVLDRIGFWDAPLADLQDFAAWPDGSGAARVA